MDYEDALKQAEVVEAQAADIREAAQREKLESAKHDKSMKRWLGYRFESSTGLTTEFASFASAYKNALKAIMTGYDMVEWSRMHFESSAFFKNMTTGKLVYVSCSDVRFWPDEWYKNILIRTAENDKDYKGGQNNYATLPNLKTSADVLTG